MTYQLLNLQRGLSPQLHPAIKCLRCGGVSYNLNDIRNRYCGHCAFFHEEDSKPDDDGDVMATALETAALAEAFDSDHRATAPDPSPDTTFEGFGGGDSGGGGASGDF